MQMLSDSFEPVGKKTEALAIYLQVWLNSHRASAPIIVCIRCLGVAERRAASMAVFHCTLKDPFLDMVTQSAQS